MLFLDILIAKVLILDRCLETNVSVCQTGEGHGFLRLPFQRFRQESHQEFQRQSRCFPPTDAPTNLLQVKNNKNHINIP